MAATETEATDGDQTENKHSWSKFNPLKSIVKTDQHQNEREAPKTTPNNPCSAQQRAVVKSVHCNRPPVHSLHSSYIALLGKFLKVTK